MSASDDRTGDEERFNPWWLVRFAIVLPVSFALLLFLPAGDWTWRRGWLFVAFSVVVMTVAGVYLWAVNPAIYAARSRFRKGTKRWDAILLCFLFPAMLSTFSVAALDDGRFHWFAVPSWAVVVGYVLLVISYGIGVWAQSVNKFFEPTVRIQTDRGQYVVDRGPYAIVRHPGYSSGIVLLAGVALSLGSLWALIPAGVASAIIVLRTRWEDQTLQAELPGYREYTTRVRYRLLPGVW